MKAKHKRRENQATDALEDVVLAMKGSEALYRSVITAMSEGIVLQDSEGVILTCNPSAEKILALTIDQIKGKTSTDPNWQAIHEDGSPFPGAMHPSMVTLRTGRPTSDTVMGVYRPDGSLVWISVNSQPLFRSGEKEPYAVVTSFTDITQRVLDNHRLSESERRYRSIIDNSLDGILLTGPDGSIFSANTAATHIFGWSEEELCAQGREGVVEMTDPRSVEFLEERTRTGRARKELTLIRKDGARFPAEVTSSVFSDKDGHLRTSMIIRDITKRKQAEIELAEKEEQYRSVFLSARDGLFINTFDGRLVDFNPAAALMHGYTPGEFRQLQPAQFIHPTSLTVFSDYLETVKMGLPFRGRAVDVCKDGTLINVEVIGTSFTYQGHPHTLAIVRDITAEVYAYQLLEQRVEKRTSELSALLEVSRQVASTHELGPLLSLILNLLKTVVDYTGAGIMVLDGGQYVMIEYQGPEPREQMVGLHYPDDLHDGYKMVVDRREPFIIDDIWGDDPWMREIQAQRGDLMQAHVRDTHSWMGVPLIEKGKFIGVLRLDHANQGHFTKEHARLALGFAEQAAMAIEKNRLYEQAQALAALEERQRLARELHDSVSQVLYGIALGARTARTLLDRDPAQAVEPVEYCLSLADAGLAEMKALIFELRPESLEMEGIVAALKKQAESVQARYHLQVKARFCDEPVIPLPAKEALYRIAQEALQNIIKHAQAGRLEMQLIYRDGFLTLEIHDDGKGFDAHREFPGHLGLKSMRERAEKIGATFVVESRAGAGTLVRVRCPIGA